LANVSTERRKIKNGGKRDTIKRKNNKFWEELIAYFPQIQHGPHRKRPVQQFFYLGFEVLTEVVMKGAIFWDITSSSPLKLN
jgi:hypothetical protein